MKAFHSLRDYVVMVLHLWGKHVAGPAMAVISLVLVIVQVLIPNPAYAGPALKIGAGASIGLAVLLIFFAQFDAWRIERARYEAEHARNARPEIQGEVCNFRLSGFYGSSVNTVRRISGEFSCDLYLCNHSPTETNFQGIEFDGSLFTPAVTFSNHVTGDVQRPAASAPNEIGQLLRNAIGVSVKGWKFSVDLECPEGHPPIDLKPLRVYVIDGLRGRHPIAVGDGERLRWF